MSDKTPYEIIFPPNPLRTKVQRTGGPGLDQIVAEAEAAIAGLCDTFIAAARADLARIDALLAEARADDGAAPAAVQAIWRICHELKGQGGTFGFPLLTAVAGSACGFIRADEATAVRRLDVIAVHIDTMKLVVHEELRGTGSAREHEVIDMLEAAVAMVTSDHRKSDSADGA